MLVYQRVVVSFTWFFGAESPHVQTHPSPVKPTGDQSGHPWIRWLNRSSNGADFFDLSWLVMLKTGSIILVIIYNINMYNIYIYIYYIMFFCSHKYIYILYIYVSNDSHKCCIGMSDPVRRQPSIHMWLNPHVCRFYTSFLDKIPTCSKTRFRFPFPVWLLIPGFLRWNSDLVFSIHGCYFV